MTKNRKSGLVTILALSCISCIVAAEGFPLRVQRDAIQNSVLLESGTFPVPLAFELIHASDDRLEFSNPGPESTRAAATRGVWLETIARIVIEPRAHEKSVLEDRSRTRLIGKCGSLDIWNVGRATNTDSLQIETAPVTHIFSNQSHVIIVVSFDINLWRKLIDGYRNQNGIPASTCDL